MNPSSANLATMQGSNRNSLDTSVPSPSPAAPATAATAAAAEGEAAEGRSSDRGSGGSGGVYYAASLQTNCCKPSDIGSAFCLSPPPALLTRDASTQPHLSLGYTGQLQGQAFGNAAFGSASTEQSGQNGEPGAGAAGKEMPGSWGAAECRKEGGVGGSKGACGCMDHLLVPQVCVCVCVCVCVFADV
jgi:hypothetical protein